MLTNSVKKINKEHIIKEHEKKEKKIFNLKLLSKINLNYLPRNSELTISSKFVACPLKNSIFSGQSRRYRNVLSRQCHVDHLLSRRKVTSYDERGEDEEENHFNEIYSLININDIYHQNNDIKNSLTKDLNNKSKEDFSYDLKYKYGISLNHNDPITAVTMSSSVVDSCSFFITCSRSKMIISLLNVMNLELINEEEIETGFGEVDWVTIDKSDQWIAMGVDRDIYVIEWSTLKIIKLEGHKERVTNVLFFYTLADPSQEYQSFLCLLSLSEDRTFISNFLIIFFLFYFYFILYLFLFYFYFIFILFLFYFYFIFILFLFYFYFILFLFYFIFILFFIIFIFLFFIILILFFYLSDIIISYISYI